MNARIVDLCRASLERPDRFQPLLAFAHLALCAAAIRARPSGLIFLRTGLAVCGVALEPIGLPRFA
jgi:hypothetical protein